MAPDLKQWEGKTVMIVCAHTKAGVQIIETLLENNVKVIGVAPYMKQIEQLRTQFPYKQRINFYTRECDMNSLGAMKATLLWVRENFSTLPALVLYLKAVLFEDQIDTLYQRGNEYRLQPFLDTSDHGQGKLYAEMIRIFGTNTAECFCQQPNCGPFWAIAYHREGWSKIMKQILERMSAFEMN